MNVLGFLRESEWDKISAIHYYRCLLPLREVNRYENGIEAITMGPGQLAAVIDQAMGIDIYHWPRLYHGDCEAFIGEIHRRNGKFVLDSDDDLTETYRPVSGRGEEFKKVLGLADHVTVSTQLLADHLAQYTKEPPVVLQNHVDVDWMAGVANKAKRVVDGVTIGFTGSRTHWGDWYLPAVPLQRIAQEFRVPPIVHGCRPSYLEYLSESVVLWNLVPYSVYPALLSQFDIVLCAVAPNDEFNSGKSAVKALECMAVGSAPICSRFGPYEGLYAAGAPVVLVEENSRDGWYEAMRALIQDKERLSQLRAAGRDWVWENRDMCRSGYKQWERFYNDIAL